MSSSPVARPTNEDRPPSRLAAAAALIVAALLLVYWPALRGGFLWDDDAHVTKAGLRSLQGLWRIWCEPGATQQYYPVLHSAFWFEHRLWGDSVLGYHLITLEFHGLAAWLLVAGLERLGVRWAWLAGLVFAVHPVCVESVAWISEQKNTLSAVCYLAAAWCYLGFDSDRKALGYWTGFGWFVAALLTKSVTATLPAALLVVFWWKRGRIDWVRDARPLLPGSPWGLPSPLHCLDRGARHRRDWADFELSAVQRLLLAGHAVCFYLGKALCPAGLIFIYPRWTIMASSLIQWGFLAFALGLGALLLVLARRNRAPAAGYLYFVGTLFPALGFVNVYPFLFSYVADHFQYLACLGVVVPVVAGLGRLVAKTGLPASIQTGILLLVPAVLGVDASLLCRSYRDSDTLNRAVLARNPDAWLAHYNLAVSLGNEPGHLAEAISHYRETVRLKPDHWSAHSNLASALLLVPGGSAEAIVEYRKAVALNPQFAEAWNDLGIALGHDPSRLPEAIDAARRALALKPAYDGAHSTLGNLLLKSPGQYPAALGELREAVRLSPRNPEYHYNLGNALIRDPAAREEAITEYHQALRYRPDYMEAHANLGSALAARDSVGAEAEFRAALKAAPGSAQLHLDLANDLAKQRGRIAEAELEYRRALSLDPTDFLAHLDYGILLSRKATEFTATMDAGSLLPARKSDAIGKARAEFEETLRLNPESADAHFYLAVCLWQLGDTAAAVPQLKRALQLRPDLKPAGWLLDRLSPRTP